MKDFEATYADIANFLEEDSKKKAEEQIHVVWFCIAEPSRRIEEGEKKLFELFKQKDYLPMIFHLEIAFYQFTRNSHDYSHKYSCANLKIIFLQLRYQLIFYQL